MNKKRQAEFNVYFNNLKNEILAMCQTGQGITVAAYSKLSYAHKSMIYLMVKEGIVKVDVNGWRV